MPNKYNPDIHHRRSIRLRHYDYSNAGAYFVTICTQNRECLFGEIPDGQMVLNDAGRMVWQWWSELNNKFPTIETDVAIVMPNHLHGIIVITNGTPVGAALCGRPDNVDHDEEGRPRRGAPTLGDIIDWFKTMTANAYIRGVKHSGWPSFPGRLWQRNYYEHVIRGEADLDAIRHYIMHNPAGWLDDENHPNAAPRPKTLS